MIRDDVGFDTKFHNDNTTLPLPEICCSGLATLCKGDHKFEHVVRDDEHAPLRYYKLVKNAVLKHLQSLQDMGLSHRSTPLYDVIALNPAQTNAPISSLHLVVVSSAVFKENNKVNLSYFKIYGPCCMKKITNIIGTRISGLELRRTREQLNCTLFIFSAA